MQRLRSMSIWGTTHHLRRLENMESVEGMRVRARKVAKGSSVNSELCCAHTYITIHHELKVSAGAQVMGERRNLLRYKSK